MNLSTSRYQLANAFKTLQLQWNIVGEHWRDVVHDEFGEKHFEPLALHVGSVLTAMDLLDQVLSKMKHDCSDEIME